MRYRRRGVNGKHAFKAHQRIARTTECAQHVAMTHKHLDRLRIDSEGPLEKGQRFRVLLALCFQQSEVMKGLDGMGLPMENCSLAFRGSLQVAGLMQCQRVPQGFGEYEISFML